MREKNFYVHVLTGLDLYSEKFLKFINENLTDKEIQNHIFIFYRKFDLSQFENIPKKNFIFMNKKNFLKIYFNLKKSKKIILHSLFNIRFLIYYLYFNKSFIKKSIWIIWGGDLYYKKLEPNSIKKNIIELVKTRIIKHIKTVAGLIKGDYLFLIKNYKTNASFIKFSYTPPVNFELLDKYSTKYKNNKKEIRILVGNSGNPSNNHLEIFDLLSKFKYENIKLICPLSYGGNQDYINKVKKKGKSIFGNKIEFYTKLKSHVEYAKILNQINIGIFNHERQQALSNILGLLYLNKKVYLRKNISTWDYLKNLNLKSYNDINLLKNQNFTDFIEIKQIENTNKAILKSEISDEKIIYYFKNLLS